MSLSDAMTDAQVRKLKDASKKLKGRELKRVVERRSLLAELAMPKATKHGTAKKLTDRQAHAALLLDHDMMALWPTSGPLVMLYGEQRGGGDRKLNAVPKDYEAARRIEDLKQMLQLEQRELLGAIERHNFESKATLATLPVHTGYADAELHKASVEGEIRALLNVVARFYESRVKQFVRRAA